MTMGELILTCDALVIVIRNGSVSVENKKIKDLENILPPKQGMEMTML